MKENEIITPLGCGRETNRLTTLSSPKNPPPCRQHVPHVHLGCFFRYLVSVCLRVRARVCKAGVAAPCVLARGHVRALLVQRRRQHQAVQPTHKPSRLQITFALHPPSAALSERLLSWLLCLK